MGVLRINGKRVKATHFAYDGCHKIYLIGSATDMAEMMGYGYTGSAIQPVSKLPQTWEDSCFLRFISWADLSLPDAVSQWREDEPTIEYRP